MDVTPGEALHSSVGALVDELVRSGVRDFSACPGSRSTPLALEIVRHPGARLWMHLDERSAAFFGLGLARARRAPVALVATSGTAAANFFPAVVEAFYGRVPLVVLTADRPHELRDCGAAQSIDQLHLYGSHARWFFDLAEPDGAPDRVRHVRTIAARAVATAGGDPPGPVHLNCPFREPLVPSAASPGHVERHNPAAHVRVGRGRPGLQPAELDELAASLDAAPRGLIVCGPQDDPWFPARVVELAERLDYPVLADSLSGVRHGRHDRSRVLDAYDPLLRHLDALRHLQPEVVIRFGAVPTSKPLLQYLEQLPNARQIVVDAGDGWNEPTNLATDMLLTDASLLCEGLSQRLPRRGDGWASEWRRADDVARRALEEYLVTIDEPFEGKAFAELGKLLPDGATLYVGNSMPVRDLDAFVPGSSRMLRCLSNRGANGIDGVVSSALGARAGGLSPLVLVIGDVSFYHDLNGLLAARQHQIDITVLLLNNDGGGIFSFLSQADDAEHFELLFGTPHGLDFKPLVEGYGGRFARADTWASFRDLLNTGLQAPGLNVIEMRTERQRNVLLHRRAWAAIAAALRPIAA